MEATIGLYTGVWKGYIGIMEKKMETVILNTLYIYIYWHYIGMMEKKMETTIM